MITVFWGASGILHWEVLEAGKTVNAQLYCEQIERAREKLVDEETPVIFLQDNAKPHTARVTKEKLAEIGWEVLAHPPYSPDMSPCDYHLFRSLEHWLRNRSLKTRAMVMETVQQFFDSKPLSFYMSGIHKLADIWSDVIDYEGEYVE